MRSATRPPQSHRPTGRPARPPATVRTPAGRRPSASVEHVPAGQGLEDEADVRVVRADGRPEAEVGLADHPLLDEEQVPLEADVVRGARPFSHSARYRLASANMAAAAGGAGSQEPAGGVGGAGVNSGQDGQRRRAGRGGESPLGILPAAVPHDGPTASIRPAAGRPAPRSARSTDQAERPRGRAGRRSAGGRLAGPASPGRPRRHRSML